MGATVLFMLADSVVWLFVARGVQGLATGAALGAASAALLDLHPRRDPAGVGLTNGVVSAGGMGLGVLVSAALVELAARPARAAVRRAVRALRDRVRRRVWRMPEPVAERVAPAPDPAAPERPARVRRPFLLAALGVISSWSIGGLFLSLGPQLSADLFHTTNHLVAGVGVFALAGSGAVAQIAVRPHAAVGRRRRRLGRARRRAWC